MDHQATSAGSAASVQIGSRRRSRNGSSRRKRRAKMGWENGGGGLFLNGEEGGIWRRIQKGDSSTVLRILNDEVSDSGRFGFSLQAIP